MLNETQHQLFLLKYDDINTILFYFCPIYFSGSIVKNYSNFWADVVAKIPIYQR